MVEAETRNSVPARGITKEQLAFEWWRQIKREKPYGAELQKVIADGDEITEIVIEMEKALLKREGLMEVLPDVPIMFPNPQRIIPYF